MEQGRPKRGTPPFQTFPQDQDSCPEAAQAEEEMDVQPKEQQALLSRLKTYARILNAKLDAGLASLSELAGASSDPGDAGTSRRPAQTTSHCSKGEHTLDSLGIVSRPKTAMAATLRRAASSLQRSESSAPAKARPRSALPVGAGCSKLDPVLRGDAPFPRCDGVLRSGSPYPRLQEKALTQRRSDSPLCAPLGAWKGSSRITSAGSSTIAAADANGVSLLRPSSSSPSCSMMAPLALSRRSDSPAATLAIRHNGDPDLDPPDRGCWLEDEEEALAPGSRPDSRAQQEQTTSYIALWSLFVSRSTMEPPASACPPSCSQQALLPEACGHDADAARQRLLLACCSDANCNNRNETADRRPRPMRSNPHPRHNYHQTELKRPVTPERRPRHRPNPSRRPSTPATTEDDETATCSEDDPEKEKGKGKKEKLEDVTSLFKLFSLDKATMGLILLLILLRLAAELFHSGALLSVFSTTKKSAS